MIRSSLHSFFTTVAVSMVVVALIGVIRSGTQADWLTLAIVAILVALGLWLAPRITARRP